MANFQGSGFLKSWGWDKDQKPKTLEQRSQSILLFEGFVGLFLMSLCFLFRILVLYRFMSRIQYHTMFDYSLLAYW